LSTTTFENIVYFIIQKLVLGQSQEELDEEEEERKRMEAEAEIQRVKARQAFLDNLAVMVAMTSIVILAVVIVILKSVMFPDDKIITFIPLPQQVKVCLQYRAFE
jgi:p-aminobenzoyl-glutamate transporter AbgT